MIKRYDWIMRTGLGGAFIDRMESKEGSFVIHADHLSELAKKDAENLVLKNGIRLLELQIQGVAEQVRERLEDVVADIGPDSYKSLKAIRTADLSDLGK